MSNAPSRSFPLGQIVGTPAALDNISQEDILKSLARHVRCDWGEVCPEDWKANDEALIDGTRLLSVYKSGDLKFWIITEADRSATTILLPSDY